MTRANRVIGFGLLILSVYTWVSANAFPPSNGIGPGPDYFPKLAAIILGLLAIMLIFKKEKQDGEVYEISGKSSALLFVLGFVVMIVYAILIQWLGFSISSVLVAISWMVLMGIRKWVTLLVASVLISAGITYVFEYLLSVPIPHGILY
jgi:putative tricarboxylic transport membrane protein